jgi:hypothetical protein
LFEKGDFTSTSDRIFAMTGIIEAHKYVDTGRKKGNVKIGE